MPNVYFVQHVPSAEHPHFFASAHLTLNITRRAMAENDYCPSGRLFEAAACGAAVISDDWPGLDNFFTPNEEILVARTPEDVVSALDRSPAEVARISEAARWFPDSALQKLPDDVFSFLLFPVGSKCRGQCFLSCSIFGRSVNAWTNTLARW